MEEEFPPRKVAKIEYFCEHGHITINGKHQVEKDYRRKTPGEWHLCWQADFATTEQILEWKEGMVSARRMDAKANLHQSVEFQHSYIHPNEVVARNTDHKLHGLDIVWVLDCTKETERLDVRKIDSTRWFLTLHEPWTFCSFSKMFTCLRG